MSCNPAPEAWSSPRIVGAATLTMKMSSSAMNCAASTRASTLPERLSVLESLLVAEHGVASDAVVMTSSLAPAEYG
jgi:hypothetical protein